MICLANIIYEILNLEITRRCNQKCAHCFQGEAQNIDITNSVIDTLLDNCSGIYTLFLSGGEVTLCPERIRYLLEACKKRQIVIFQLSFITNGTERNTELVQILKEWDAYISSFYDSTPPLKTIHIGISFDEFHNADDSQKGFAFWKEQLEGVASVVVHSPGRIPRKTGRGVNVPYAIDYTKELFKIQYITDTHAPLCTQRYTRRVYNEEQMHVCCDLTLTAKGDLVVTTSHSYSEVDSNQNLYIANIFEIHENSDLITAIERYNENKPFCECGLLKSTGDSNKENTVSNDWAGFLKGCETLVKIDKIAQKHPDPDFYGGLLWIYLHELIDVPLDIQLDTDGILEYNAIMGRGVELSELKKIDELEDSGIDSITPEKETELRELLLRAKTTE